MTKSLVLALGLLILVNAGTPSLFKSKSNSILSKTDSNLLKSEESDVNNQDNTGSINLLDLPQLGEKVVDKPVKKLDRDEILSKDGAEHNLDSLSDRDSTEEPDSLGNSEGFGDSDSLDEFRDFDEFIDSDDVDESEDSEDLDESEDSDDVDESEDQEDLDESEDSDDLDESEYFDNVDESEDSDDVDESEYFDNVDESEDSGDIEESEDSDDVNESEDSEGLDESEDSDDIEESEDSDDIEESEDSDDIEEPEDSDDIEESEDSDSLVETDSSEDTPVTYEYNATEEVAYTAEITLSTYEDPEPFCEDEDEDLDDLDDIEDGDDLFLSELQLSDDLDNFSYSDDQVAYNDYTSQDLNDSIIYSIESLRYDLLNLALKNEAAVQDVYADFSDCLEDGDIEDDLYEDKLNWVITECISSTTEEFASSLIMYNTYWILHSIQYCTQVDDQYRYTVLSYYNDPQEDVEPQSDPSQYPSDLDWDEDIDEEDEMTAYIETRKSNILLNLNSFLAKDLQEFNLLKGNYSKEDESAVHKLYSDLLEEVEHICNESYKQTYDSNTTYGEYIMVEECSECPDRDD